MSKLGCKATILSALAIVLSGCVEDTTTKAFVVCLDEGRTIAELKQALVNLAENHGLEVRDRSGDARASADRLSEIADAPPMQHHHDSDLVLLLRQSQGDNVMAASNLILYPGEVGLTFFIHNVSNERASLHAEIIERVDQLSEVIPLSPNEGLLPGRCSSPE